MALERVSVLVCECSQSLCLCGAQGVSAVRRKQYRLLLRKASKDLTVFTKSKILMCHENLAPFGLNC